MREKFFSVKKRNIWAQLQKPGTFTSLLPSNLIPNTNQWQWTVSCYGVSFLAVGKVGKIEGGLTIGKHRDLLGCQKNVCFSMTYWKYLTSIEWSNQNTDIKPIECLWRDLKMSVHRCSTSNLWKLHWICQEREKVFRCAKLHSGNIQNKTKRSTESKVLIYFYTCQHLIEQIFRKLP